MLIPPNNVRTNTAVARRVLRRFIYNVGGGQLVGKIIGNAASNGACEVIFAFDEQAGVGRIVDESGFDKYGGHVGIFSDENVMTAAKFSLQAAVDGTEGINDLPLNPVGKLFPCGGIFVIESLGTLRVPVKAVAMNRDK